MPTVNITVSNSVAEDFNTLAREKGCANGKAFLIALAKAELAHWRAVKAAESAVLSEMEKLEGEIS